MAPHTVACRKRMEGAVRAKYPNRWEKFLLRRRQEEAAQEESEVPVNPGAEGAQAEDASLFGDWERRDLGEVAESSSIPTPSGGVGAVAPCEAEASKELSERKPGRPK